MLVRAFGLAITAMVLNTAITLAWLWFHQIALAPGHDPAHYQDYAERAAPLLGLVGGIPLLFAAGWLAAALSGGRAPLGSAVLVAVLYAALDLVLLLLFARAPVPWGLAALSWLTKLAAAAAGARLAVRAGFADPLPGSD